MTTAHKIQLCPNNKETTYFKKACGIARLAWNWGLAMWNEQYKNGEQPSGFSLKKAFNKLKKTDYPFVYEVTKYACQQPFIDLQKSFQRFFEKTSHRPKFKKKNKSKDSFYIGGDQIQVKDKYVKIPKLGWVKMTEELRFEGKVNNAVVSRTADKWFISFSLEVEFVPTISENQASVGIDLGINHFAVLSSGIAIDAPKPLKKELRKLKRLNRKLSKKKKGSKNFKKIKLKITRLYAKIANIRKDFLQKLTTFLAINFQYIAIEDLHVKGMVKNKKLARSISDLAWHEFKRQLTYKLERVKKQLLICDGWFASSKTCSCCGHKKEKLSLSTRSYTCEKCKLSLDRDLNAAKNMEQQLKIPVVHREFKPVEMTAMLAESGILSATSIVESGMQHQIIS